MGHLDPFGRTQQWTCRVAQLVIESVLRYITILSARHPKDVLVTTSGLILWKNQVYMGETRWKAGPGSKNWEGNGMYSVSPTLAERHDCTPVAFIIPAAEGG